MGCHTWFHRKVDTLKPEEVKQSIVEYLEDAFMLYDALLNNPDSLDPELLDLCSPYTKEEIELEKAEHVHVMERIESGEMSESELNNCFHQFVDSKFEFIENKGWFYRDSDLPHDLFRNYNYLEIKLFSLKETLKFISENPCEVYDDTNEKLEIFWKEHPDGMIDFG